MTNQVCLVVEDHPLTAEGMAASVKAAYPYFDMHVHKTIASAIAFLDTLPIQIQGIALVDVKLGDGSGLDLLAALRAKKFEALKSIVISATTERQDVDRAKELGARGFIPKSTALELVMKVVGIVDAGGECFLPVEVNGDEPAATRGPAVLDELAENLPKNQRKILDLLVLGHSDKEIARLVGVSDGHVGNVANSIYKSLGISRRSQLVRLAHDSGYQSR